MKIPAPPARVLNVDDNEIGRYTKSRILKQAGFEVLEAVNGAEALEAVRERQPQLVLLDLQLPDVSGFEVCRRIKSDPATARIPVLHITATAATNTGTVSGLNLAIVGNEIQARNNSAASPLFINAGGGNVSIGTTTANARLRVLNATCDGTTWNNASDRNLKAGFEPVDARRVLEQVAALPLTSWHYTNAPDARHLGPMAQDFQAAFGLGADDKSITTVDADGVALAAIQGLNALLKAQAAELKALKQELAELRRAVKAGQ